MLTQQDLRNPEKYKRIVDYVNGRIDDYWHSKCYTSLTSRYDRLFRLIYMDRESSRNAYTGANEWLSKISVPLVREMYIVLRAAMKRSWNQDPLISLEPLGSTTYGNATNAQEVLNLNYKNTFYRERVLKEIYRSCASYGSAITFSQFEERINKSGKQTVFDNMLGYQRKPVDDITANCWNYAINIRNYFQNPNIAEFECTDYKGHEKRYFLTDLIAEVKRNPDAYIKEKLAKVIDEAKKQTLAASSKTNNSDRLLQESDISIDVYSWVGKIHIKGNEEDDTDYVLQITGDHIFKFAENQNDFNIDGYSIFNLDKYERYWWSNTPIENAVSYENIMSILMQTNIDSLMQGLERYIFYDAGSIDFADINTRHKNDGFVPVRMKDLPMQNMIYDYQRKSNAGQGFKDLMAETKEAAQRVSVKADLSRQGLAGGPRNETLGAAQILVEQGQTQEFDIFDNMTYGFKQNANQNIVLMQMNLPLIFNSRDYQTKVERELELKDILGQYAYNVETSLTKNTTSEIQRLANVVTMLINWKGTGNAAFQNVDKVVSSIAKEIIRKNNLPNINADEAFPDMQAMQQQMPLQGLPADQGMQPQLQQLPMPQPQTQPMMGAA